MIPIVGVSLEEALLGFGGDDTELHDKEVTLTTSDVTGSQTAIFEYDPQNEPVSGDPPGPWDGYGLFTIDLSGVKDDIEDLQQRISDAETCRQQVIAALQRYDPDYDPAEGECPSDKVGEVVDEVGELKDKLEQCHDCKDEVIAAIQQYIPDYDPASTDCPADEIDDVYQKGRDDEEEENPPGYTFPAGVEIPDEVFTDFHTQIEDMNMPNTTVSFYAKIRIQDERGGEYRYEYRPINEVISANDYPNVNAAAVWFIVKVGNSEYDIAQSNGYNLRNSEWKFDIDSWDKTTADFSTKVQTRRSWRPDEWTDWGTYSHTVSSMAGYGDPSHTYRAKNVNN